MINLIGYNIVVMGKISLGTMLIIESIINSLKVYILLNTLKHQTVTHIISHLK